MMREPEPGRLDAVALAQHGYAWSHLELPAPDACCEAPRPIRDVFDAGGAYEALARIPALRRLASDALGEMAWPVRASLFAKSKASNWSVPWHQDRVVWLRERHAVAGFHAWSEKGGILRASAPEAVLSRMLALRVHLDPCDRDAGPLEVLPGTHRQIHDAACRDRMSAEIAPIRLTAGAGDVLLMRPLLVHRSARASRPTTRRILHVEFASRSLPGLLRWRYGPRRE